MTSSTARRSSILGGELVKKQAAKIPKVATTINIKEAQIIIETACRALSRLTSIRETENGISERRIGSVSADAT
jgi:hypothetical protein